MPWSTDQSCFLFNCLEVEVEYGVLYNKHTLINSEYNIVDGLPENAFAAFWKYFGKGVLKYYWQRVTRGIDGLKKLFLVTSFLNDILTKSY